AQNQQLSLRRLDETDVNGSAVLENCMYALSEVKRQEKALAVESEVDLLDRACLGAAHRAGFVLRPERPRPEPLEEARPPPVDPHVEERGRRPHAAHRAAADRDLERLRGLASEPAVDALEPLTEDLVEEVVHTGGLVVPVPPEPVAALGDVEI